jgi:hypothetical protein
MVVQFLEFEHLSKISTLTVMLMTVEYMHCPHIRFPDKTLFVNINTIKSLIGIFHYCGTVGKL